MNRMILMAILMAHSSVADEDMDAYLMELEATAAAVEEEEQSEWRRWEQQSQSLLRRLKYRDYSAYQKFYDLPEHYRVELLKTWSQGGYSLRQMSKMIRKRHNIIVAH